MDCHHDALPALQQDQRSLSAPRPRTTPADSVPNDPTPAACLWAARAAPTATPPIRRRRPCRGRSRRQAADGLRFDCTHMPKRQRTSSGDRDRQHPEGSRNQADSGHHAETAQALDVVGGIASLPQHRFIVLADRRRPRRRDFVHAVDMERRHHRKPLAVAERHQRAGMRASADRPAPHSRWRRCRT